MLVAFLATAALLGATARAQELEIRPQFEAAGHFHDGIAPVMQDGQWGFVDVAGNWMVRPQFESVTAGDSRRFGVRARGLWGYVNTAGQVVIPPRYLDAAGFSEGVAPVSEDGRHYYQIDTDGNRLDDEIDFLSISSMDDGVATVQRADGQWTATGKHESYWMSTLDIWEEDESGTGGRQVEIEVVTPFRESTAFARTNGRYRLVWFDPYGIPQVSVVREDRPTDTFPTFAEVREFSEGLAAVSPDGVLWGFIERSGDFVIQPQFEAAREFSEGVAPVQLGGRWGFIDRSGRLVFQPRYDRAYSFREGFATIRQGELRGFLRHDGAGGISVALEPQFEDVFSFREGLAPIRTGGLWGYISAPGVDVTVLPPIRQEMPAATLRP